MVGGLALFKYAANSPLMYVDPTGLVEIEICRRIDYSFRVGNLRSFSTTLGLASAILRDYLNNVCRDYLAILAGNKNEWDDSEIWYAPVIGAQPEVGRKVNSEYRRLGRRYRNLMERGPEQDPAVPPQGDRRRLPTPPVFKNGILGTAIGTPSGGVDMVVRRAAVKRNTKGSPAASCYMLDMEVIWTMKDEVDWRSFDELFNQLGEDAGILDRCVTGLEGVFDLVGDRLLGLNYPLTLRWKEHVVLWVEP